MNKQRLIEAFASIPALEKIDQSLIRVAYMPKNLSGKAALYLALDVTDPELQKELTMQIMCETIPKQFNEKYGTQINTGHVSSGGPTGVTLHYGVIDLADFLEDEYEDSCKA